MDKVLSYEQVQGFSTEIRSLKLGFVTNFFWNNQKHSYWIDNGEFFYKRSVNCYILIHKNSGFFNLFYIASNMISVSEAIKGIDLQMTCVIDIISQNEEVNKVDIFIALGFQPYKQLYRMAHIGPLADDHLEKLEEVSYGNETDAQIIYEILQRDFDPFSEQLPTIQEIRDYANRKHILVIKDGETLCGFLIFEMSGQTLWYLRYWYTVPKYRNNKIGSKLLKTALSIGRNSKRQQLWVISDNENAILRYKHYGFYKEKINDYVMIKQI